MSDSRNKSLFPDDPEIGCGYGPFKIDDPLFNHGCMVHDAQFSDQENGTHYQPRPGKHDDPVLTLEESNARLFRNWERSWREYGGSPTKWVKMQFMKGCVKAFSWLFW